VNRGFGIDRIGWICYCESSRSVPVWASNHSSVFIWGQGQGQEKNQIVDSTTKSRHYHADWITLPAPFLPKEKLSGGTISGKTSERKQAVHRV
jgi:hypothetical protein